MIRFVQLRPLARWERVVCVALLLSAGCGEGAAATWRIVASPGAWQPALAFSHGATAEMGISLAPATNASAIAQLCRGDADVAFVTRTLRRAERAQCEAAERGSLIEWTLPVEPLALWVHAASLPTIHGLDTGELRRVFTAEEAGGAHSWAEVRGGLPDIPIVVLGPPAPSEIWAQLRAGLLAPGAPLRANLAPSLSEAGMPLALSHTPGAIAIGSATLPAEVTASIRRLDGRDDRLPPPRWMRRVVHVVANPGLRDWEGASAWFRNAQAGEIVPGAAPGAAP